MSFVSSLTKNVKREKPSAGPAMKAEQKRRNPALSGIATLAPTTAPVVVSRVRRDTEESWKSAWPRKGTRLCSCAT